MRRLLRILTSVATVLSLVLCVAAMAAWLRGYRVSDVVWWSLANPRLQSGIATHRGGLFALVVTPVGTRDRLLPPGAGWQQQSAPVSHPVVWDSQGTFFKRFGFALDYYDSPWCAV